MTAAHPGSPADPVAASTERPLVGFTYSPSAALDEGLDQDQALRDLVRVLKPDLIRLPVYWSDVAATRGKLDYASVDRFLADISSQDHQQGTTTQVVLVLGARNVSYPELHAPPWTAGLTDPQLLKVLAGADYHDYLATTVTRYRDMDALFGWQVENEPLDPVFGGGATGLPLPAKLVAEEVKLVHQLDGGHPVAVTTYNSSSLDLDQERLSPISWLYDRLPGPKAAGHPGDALKLGDALGLDLYVATPNTTDGASVSTRITWKEQSLNFWSTRAAKAGKQLWIMEMQAAAWAGAADFEPADLRNSAHAYAATGASVVLLWGVESWLNSPEWLEAGRESLSVLRATPLPGRAG